MWVLPVVIYHTRSRMYIFMYMQVYVYEYKNCLWFSFVTYFSPIRTFILYASRFTCCTYLGIFDFFFSCKCHLYTNYICIVWHVYSHMSCRVGSDAGMGRRKCVGCSVCTTSILIGRYICLPHRVYAPQIHAYKWLHTYMYMELRHTYSDVWVHKRLHIGVDDVAHMRKYEHVHTCIHVYTYMECVCGVYICTYKTYMGVLWTLENSTHQVEAIWWVY